MGYPIGLANYEAVIDREKKKLSSNSLFRQHAVQSIAETKPDQYNPIIKFGGRNGSIYAGCLSGSKKGTG